MTKRQCVWFAQVWLLSCIFGYVVAGTDVPVDSPDVVAKQEGVLVSMLRHSNAHRNQNYGEDFCKNCLRRSCDKGCKKGGHEKDAEIKKSTRPEATGLNDLMPVLRVSDQTSRRDDEILVLQDSFIVSKSDLGSDFNIAAISDTLPPEAEYFTVINNRMKKFIFKAEAGKVGIKKQVSLSSCMRKNLFLSVNQSVVINQFSGECEYYAGDFKLTIVQVIDKNACGSVNFEKVPFDSLVSSFKNRCASFKYPLYNNHRYVFSHKNRDFVVDIELKSAMSEYKDELERVLLLSPDAICSEISVTENVAKKIDVINVPYVIHSSSLAEKFEFSGEPYGIGGVDNLIKTFVSIFVAPRLLTGQLQMLTDIKLSRGGILYGPPGTGKTLLVSVLGSILEQNGFDVETKIVSGPEVFNQYVGSSEERVRDIFSFDAKYLNGRNKKRTIKLILIDEIDSMLSVRGGVSNGVSDKVVNQFLTCLDGIEKKDDIIVFGTTNRIDLIDPAALRPGRLDQKVKMMLPNKEQRHQILRVQSKSLRKEGMLSSDVDMGALAEKTLGYTGAELSALITNAVSSAILREQGLTHSDNFFKPKMLGSLCTLKVKGADIHEACEGIKPQFGPVNVVSLDGKTWKYYSVSKLYENVLSLIKDFKNDENRSVLRVLITGCENSGKSTMAVLIQKLFSDFYRYVPATEVIGVSQKVKFFMDVFAKRSSQRTDSDSSYTIIFDDFDTMICYDGYSFYERSLVSALDAGTKQSLKGCRDGKLLVIVISKSYEGSNQRFLPHLFPQNRTFNLSPES